MRTHDQTTETRATPADAELQPTKPWSSQILSEPNPTSAMKDVLAVFARNLDAPLLAVYRVVPGSDGQIGLRVDESVAPHLGVNVDLEALGAALIQSWGTELSSLQRVLQPVADLPSDIVALLNPIDASVVAAQPVRVGNRFVALLLITLRADFSDCGAALENYCELAAEAVSIAILRERSSDHARLTAVLAYAFDIISVVAPDGTILYHTPTFARILGNITDNFVGDSAFDSIHPDDRPMVATAFAKLLQEPGGQRRIEVRLKHHNGSWRHFEALGTNQIDNPLIGGIVVTAYDVTDRKQLERKLNWQAFHDPLTKLANRSLLLNDLRRALARAQRSGNVVGILFLDLDGFKEVNDHFGHPAGDQLLTQIADRLLACVRAGETVARLGGDEFVVLLEGLAADADAERAATRILDAVRMPVRLSHGNVDITASMGISLASGESVDPDELLIQADSALYQAKRAGRARFEFYVPV